MALRSRKTGRISFKPHSESHDCTYYGLGRRTLAGSGSQPYLDTQTSAKLAEAAYTFGGAYGTKKQRKHDTNSQIESTGFKLLPRFSGRQMSVFAKTLPGGGTHLHIAHKGTQPQSLGGLRDLVSDVRIGLGMAMGDSQFNERLKTSEAAVNAYNPQILTMSGHSLGGATMNDSITRSKLLRAKVDQADSFDAGASPFFSNTVTAKLSDEDKERLGDVMTHHRKKHDLVSKGLLYASPPGDVVTYKLNTSTGDDNLTKEEIKEMSTAKRALEAHHIDRFSENDNLEVSNIKGHDDAKRIKVDKDQDVSGAGSTGPVTMSDSQLLDGIEKILAARGFQEGGSKNPFTSFKKVVAPTSQSQDSRTITGPGQTGDKSYDTARRIDAIDRTIQRSSQPMGAQLVGQQVGFEPSVGYNPADVVMDPLSLGFDLASGRSDRYKAGKAGGYVGKQAGTAIGSAVGGDVGAAAGGIVGQYWGSRGAKAIMDTDPVDKLDKLGGYARKGGRKIRKTSKKAGRKLKKIF